MLDRLPEILVILVLGLIVFGPKKMIELGGQIGRSLRELRSAMKEMNWNPLGDESASKPGGSSTILGALSQLAQDMTTAPSASAEQAPAPHVVEPVVEAAEPTPTATQPTHDTTADERS